MIAGLLPTEGGAAADVGTVDPRPTDGSVDEPHAPKASPAAPRKAPRSTSRREIVGAVPVIWAVEIRDSALRWGDRKCVTSGHLSERSTAKAATNGELTLRLTAVNAGEVIMAEECDFGTTVANRGRGADRLARLVGVGRYGHGPKGVAGAVPVTGGAGWVGR